MAHNVSQMSTLNSAIQGNSPPNQKPDEERVVCQGWLYILKSKGGVRQWKKLWAVLRPRALGLYKNEEVDFMLRHLRFDTNPTEYRNTLRR